jgi:hypothetical protein
MKRAGMLSHDEIAARAYGLWIERGYREGHAAEDWREAERQLLAERASPSAARVRPARTRGSVSTRPAPRPRVRRRVVGPDLASK